MSHPQNERSSFRPEVLMVNQPVLSTRDSDRTMTYEAPQRTNLSLDSAPTSNALRLYSDIRCTHCQSNQSNQSNAPLLLDENQLYQKGILSFVQLNPCGHTYCTRCFERMLTNQSQAASCSGQYLPNNQKLDCRLQVLVPTSAVTRDKVVVEARECRFDAPSGSFLNIGELRLSLLDQRERISPGQVVIRSWQAQTQPDVKATSPVWVFMTMSTNLERLWQLVRELMSDGRLFHRLSNDSQSSNQRAMYQGMNSGSGPLHFIREAGIYRNADENHVVRNEAAILTVAPRPPMLNPPRATSGDTQPLNPNAQPVRGEPDYFSSVPILSFS